MSSLLVNYNSVGESILSPLKCTLITKLLDSINCLFIRFSFQHPKGLAYFILWVGWLSSSLTALSYFSLCDLPSEAWCSYFLNAQHLLTSVLGLRVCCFPSGSPTLIPLMLGSVLSIWWGDDGAGGSDVMRGLRFNQWGRSFSWLSLHLLGFLVPNAVARDRTGWQN